MQTDHQMRRMGATGTAAALREAADFITTHADLPMPYITTRHNGLASVSYQLMNTAPKDQKAVAAAIVRAVGGEWGKWSFSDTFYLEQSIGLLEITISAARDQVCTRRVVGTETITVPAVEAAPERTEEREVVEWDCDPILAGASDA